MPANGYYYSFGMPSTTNMSILQEWNISIIL